MDWLKARLVEPSSYVGIIMFLVGVIGARLPAVKDLITEDIALGLGNFLAALGGILFGKPKV
jgi:hypothetical protein